MKVRAESIVGTDKLSNVTLIRNDLFFILFIMKIWNSDSHEFELWPFITSNNNKNEEIKTKFLIFGII